MVGSIGRGVSSTLRKAGMLLMLMLAVLLVVGGGVQMLYGQGGSATVTGTVTDQSSAVIPNINILLRDEATGAVRRTVTNSDGFFTITALPVGTYTLEIEAAGFAKFQRKGITLHASDRINVPDITLSVATVAQEVKVQATPDVVVPVDSGEKSQVILARQIQNLSIVGRSAVELLKILPGVVYRNQDQEAGLTVQFNRGIGDYNVAGQRSTEIANVSDGQDVIDPGCNCGSAVTPNVDMMAEVKVQTSNFSAENAKGPVIFNAVSKSGTSAYHGEAYTYLRHHKLNSVDWRVNRFDSPKPKDYYYFPGFNIGGPVRLPWSDFNKNRDKMFFFAGVEWMKQNHALGVIPADVPTEAMREGDFSDADYIGSLNGYDVNQVPRNDDEGNSNWSADPITPAMLSGGVIDPSAIDPGGAILMSMYPLPNQDPKVSGGYNYTSNIVNPENRNQQLVRIDYNISDNTKMYTRFNHEYQASPSPYTLWWYNTNDVPYPGNIKGDYRTWVVSTSLVRVINPTTTNEVIFGYTKWRMPHKVLNPDKVSRSALGYPYKGLWKNPTDQIPDATDWGGGVADFIQPGGLMDPEGIFADKVLLNVVDNFTKVAATHTLKFGAFLQITTNQEPTTSSDHGDFEFTNWGNNSTNNAYADMLMGRVGEYSEATTNTPRHYRRNEFSFYAQDSWKVTRRFTLELGARFAHQGWFFEENGYIFGFDPALYDPDAPMTDYSGLIASYKGDSVASKSIWKTKPLVVSPRLGFAYDLFGNGKTVIRGGAGAFAYHGRGGDNWTVGNPPLLKSATICCGYLMPQIDAIDPVLYPPKVDIQAVEPTSYKIPITYSWSFTISQRLPYSTVLETSYVGNSASHQLTDQNDNNINIVPWGTMLPDKVPTGADPNDYRIYQSYGEVALVSHSLSQNYNALQVTVNRQTGRVNYAVSYSWSKALGTGGESYGAAVDVFDRKNHNYGPLGYDRTHGLSIAYNVLLPDPTGNPVLKHFINGWQVSGITQFQSGGPLGEQVGDDIGSAVFDFSGDLGIIDPRTGELMEWDDENVTGTPDSPARPVLVCDPRTGLADGQYANPNCFRAPTPGHNGMYQLPYMKRPGFQNHDLSVFKNFALSSTNEALKLQFRFSMFNFLNHPLPYFQGGGPGLAMNFANGVPDQSTLDHFGRPDLKRGRRLLQFALKFSF